MNILPRTVVYTCTDLAYDQVFSPVAATPGVDYVLFSDRRPRFVRGWQWRPKPQAVAGLGSAMANRRLKFFPGEVFPEADLSIYLDANILVLGDLGPLIAEFLASGAEIGLFVHGERRDVASELAFCAEVGKVSPEEHQKGEAQLAGYRARGCPDDARLTENGIILRRHDGPRLGRAMALWWDELNAHTRRDQLSLPFVLHETGIATKLFDWNYREENPYFHRYPHRSGILKDAYILMRNKRHYGRANHYLYGAVTEGYRRLLGSRS